MSHCGNSASQELKQHRARAAVAAYCAGRTADAVGIPPRTVRYHGLAACGGVLLRSRWSDRERDILREAEGLGLERAVAALRAAGFRRSREAIRAELRRRGIGATFDDATWYTAAELAQCAGTTTRRIEQWMQSGTLQSRVLAGQRRSSRGMIRAWLLSQVGKYDHRRLDWIWTLEILTGARR